MECKVLDCICFLATIVALLFAWYTYNKDKKAKAIQMLAKEVIAFYSIEQEAIKMLKEKDSDKSEQTIPTDSASEKTAIGIATPPDEDRLTHDMVFRYKTPITGVC